MPSARATSRGPRHGRAGPTADRPRRLGNLLRVVRRLCRCGRRDRRGRRNREGDWHPPCTLCPDVARRAPRPTDASPLIESAIRDAGTGGQGLSVQWAEWASAILFNGLGRYDRALASAQRAAEETPHLHVTPWALTELIEAAVRTARFDVAASALERVMAATAPSSTDWGRGMQARCQALLSKGESAERLHREAIERLARTRRRPERARAHLLYGEWLRREHRRVDARVAAPCCPRPIRVDRDGGIRRAGQG